MLSDLTYNDPLCNHTLVDYSVTRNSQVLSVLYNQISILKNNSSLEFASENSTLPMNR